MTKIKRYNNKQIKILKALGWYKFLTYSQIVRLGIEKHKNNLSVLMKELRESRKPLVRKIPNRVGTEMKHYLTKRGKEVLQELYNLEEERMKYPKGIITTDTQDQKHRTGIISCQIELDLACEKKQVPVLFCDRYFDTVGNNRIDRNLKSKTAVVYEGKKTLKADLVFMLQTPTQKELYLLELENGKDTKKAIEKCIAHGKAIERGTANEKYNLYHGYRTLWIFEYKSIMNATIERLQSNSYFNNLTEYFLFKSFDEIGIDFFGGWLNIAGKEKRMYYNTFS